MHRVLKRVELFHVDFELRLEIIAVFDVPLELRLGGLELFFGVFGLLGDHRGEGLLVIRHLGLLGFHCFLVDCFSSFVLVNFVTDEFANVLVFVILELALGSLGVNFIGNDCHLVLEVLGQFQTLLSVLLKHFFVFKIQVVVFGEDSLAQDFQRFV